MHANKKFVLLLVIAVSCGLLSVSAYRASVRLSLVQQAELEQNTGFSQPASLIRDGANRFDSYAISFSPVSLSKSANRKTQLLEQEAKELRARLGFMVFARERTETQKSLQKILQQQVNGNPFVSSYWRDLTFVQQGLSVSDEEYKNTFLIAKKLSRWNVQQRGVLINRCVIEYQKLDGISPDLCADLFANLPLADDVRRLSNIVGVEYSVLLTFLKQLGLNVSGEPE